LVHAVAHIEFNAINLAWDAVYRFRDMPPAYYRDWVAVAADEARHYSMLVARLAELGHAYGDFDAHDGLWTMAARTADSCLARMALVPRVLEARGLDVTPGMIERLRSVGDQATAEILEVILREEVAHVAAGSRWFTWCCVRDGVDPRTTFRDFLARFLPGGARGPFTHGARPGAGLRAGGDSGGHPARGSRARRGGFALVHLVLRARWRRSAHVFPRLARPLHARRRQGSVQSRGAAPRGLRRRRTRGSGSLRRLPDG